MGLDAPLRAAQRGCEVSISGRGSSSHDPDLGRGACQPQLLCDSMPPGASYGKHDPSTYLLPTEDIVQPFFALKWEMAASLMDCLYYKENQSGKGIHV